MAGNTMRNVLSACPQILPFSSLMAYIYISSNKSADDVIARHQLDSKNGNLQLVIMYRECIESVENNCKNPALLDQR